VLLKVKKISIIGSVGLPANYGGWETLVDHLTKNLSGSMDIDVYCSAKRYDVRLDSYNGANLKYVNLDANGIQSIPYDVVSMLRAIGDSDTILVLGVSGCIFLPIINLFYNKNIIVNIDGLEWKRDKWSAFAKWFLKLSESVAVKYADITVSDNKAIQDYVLSEYGKKSELIAYGADHVNYVGFDEEDVAKFIFLGKPYAFKVCRIEPENNVHMIIAAFLNNKKFDLVIVGNWGNSAYGINLKKKYSEIESIHLLDPIYDQYELNKIRGNCNVYIHGHSAGGTNPSLVEAMYLGLPVIAYGVSYNKETTHGLAKYFNSEVDLKNIISSIDTEELSLIAKKMKGVAVNNYIWSRISDQYSNIF
jgi:glycosyltransferase involved in cell wall biosynthesis